MCGASYPEWNIAFSEHHRNVPWVTYPIVCTQGRHQASSIYGQCLLHVDMQGKGGVVRMHSVKAYMGSGGFAPLILNLNTGWKWVVDFRIRPVYSRERTPVRNEEEAVCATKPAQSFWRREKSLGPASFVCHYRWLFCIPVKWSV